MPANTPDTPSSQAAFEIGDNLVQDMQGLLLRLHAACDLLKALLERAETVLNDSRTRLSVIAQEDLTKPSAEPDGNH